MNLEKNLIDNVLECEVKLGHVSQAIRFYYPLSSLTELLSCDEYELPEAIRAFQKEEIDRLHAVTIEKHPKEAGRFCVTVPAEGVDWISANFAPSDFMKAFIPDIYDPNHSIQQIVDLFRSFDAKAEIRQKTEEEWIMSFTDESVDPYVYCIEQNEFGLEYHRFTRMAFEKLDI